MGGPVHGNIYGDYVGGDKVAGDKVEGNKSVFYGPGDDNRTTPAGRRDQRRSAGTILLMAANPGGTPPLRLDEERRTIDQAVARVTDRLTVHVADAMRLDDLQTALLRHEPVIAHFSGHGTRHTGIVVTDDTGAIRLVPPEALTDLFRILSRRLHCVVLNACFTDEQARAIAAHVPCVVGMRSQVLDDSAIRFAAGFYDGIAHGRSIQSSFELGRNRLRLYGHPDDRTPVLIAAKGDAERAVVPD